MSVLKSRQKQLVEERRENERLRADINRQKAITAFIGLLAADLDVDKLIEEEEDGDIDG